MSQTALDQQITMTGAHYGETALPVLAGILIPMGTLVFVDATTGYATNTDNAGANEFAGVAKSRFDNTNGASGDINAELYAHGNRFELPFNDAVALTDQGKPAYAQDNYGLSPSSTSATRVGIIERFLDSGTALVRTGMGGDA